MENSSGKFKVKLIQSQKMLQYSTAKKRTENLIGEKVLKISEQHVTEIYALSIEVTFYRFFTNLQVYEKEEAQRC